MSTVQTFAANRTCYAVPISVAAAVRVCVCVCVCVHFECTQRHARASMIEFDCLWWHHKAYARMSVGRQRSIQVVSSLRRGDVIGQRLPVSLCQCAGGEGAAAENAVTAVNQYRHRTDRTRPDRSRSKLRALHATVPLPLTSSPPLTLPSHLF